MRSTPARGLLSLFLSLLLLATACGSGGPSAGPASPDADTTAAATTASGGSPTAVPSASSSPAPAFPVTVAADNGPVTIEERPDRIVSLSPTTTEMLFAIGAGEQVVAVDDNSNFPSEAPMTELSGFQPNVEAITTFEPDLVVLSFDPGGISAGLEAVGVPPMVHDAAATLDDAYSQIEQLGAATGHVGEAAAVVGEMQGEIADIVASTPTAEAELSYYHELDSTYFSATSQTFIGQVYGLLELTNIADATATEDAGGFPQLSAEYIVEADPDLIFLADTKCCDVSAETVADRPGWDQITAVENGAVVELDDDVASRWGPRIVDLLRAVAAAVTEVATAPAG